MKRISRKLCIKLLGLVTVILFTTYVGVSYVAPRVILKLTRHVSTSSAADYGMRYEDCLVVSEDSLDLHGDLIFPFDLEHGQAYGNHSMIVLHEISANSKSSYQTIKPLITLDVNFITFDSRGHGRSDGFMYTMGNMEADDISKIIDSFIEKHPDHSFGIYAKGNACNVALKAMENDKRIHYGIVEHYFPTIKDHMKYINNDDVVYSSNFIDGYILDNTLDYLNTSKEELAINTELITQPILMLSTPYNLSEMSLLHDSVSSENKYLMVYKENIGLTTSYPRQDEGLLSCLTEFIEMYSEEARQYIKDQIFQPT